MSTPSEPDGPTHIAGEPASQTPGKSVPPLSTSDSPSRVENQPQNRTPVAFALIQVMMLVLALAASGYAAYTVATWPEESNVNSNSNELLVRTEGRDADGLCAEGGSIIHIGMDHNLNQYLDGDEITSTTNLCHGETGASGSSYAGLEGLSSMIDTEVLPLGNQTCTTGGLAIHAGLDENRDGELNPYEITSTEWLCNGAVGLTGANGGQGQDGHLGLDGASALVVQNVPLASVCPLGISIDFGVDDGAGEGVAFDAQLHDDEIHSSLNICSQPLSSGPLGDFNIGISDGVTTGCDQLTWMPRNGKTIAAGSDGVNGCEVWASDATGMLSLLVDLNPSGDSMPGRFAGFTVLDHPNSELVVFDADDGVNGRQLWVTDGTSSGTARLGGTASTSVTNQVSSVKWLDGLVMLNHPDSMLWTNGTSTMNVLDHPVLNASLDATTYQNLAALSSYHDAFLLTDDEWLWFSAKSTNGIEPYALHTDGTLKSWDLSSEDANPGPVIGLPGGVAVVADDGSGRQVARLNHDGSHLWLTSMVYDGTGGPTEHVGQHLGLHRIGDVLIFDALTSGVDPQVWAHNLSQATTELLSQSILAPGDWAGGIVHQNRLWFDCVAPGIAHEVCSTDGTVDGTRTETDLRAGSASALVRSFASNGDALFMIASGQVNGTETGSVLWLLDEHDAPQMLYDAWPGLNNNSNTGTYGGLVVSEHHVYFAANDGSTGHEWHAFSHGSLTGEWLIWPA